MKTVGPPSAAATNAASPNPDPFHRKSVRKPPKGPQKKQQGSSKFRTKVNLDIQQLSLLKGISFPLFIKCCMPTCIPWCIICNGFARVLKAKIGLVFTTRFAACGATRIVHEETTTVFDSFRFYGSSGRVKRKRNKKSYFKWISRLYYFWERNINGGCLPRSCQNGKSDVKIYPYKSVFNTKLLSKM